MPLLSELNSPEFSEYLLCAGAGRAQQITQGPGMEGREHRKPHSIEDKTETPAQLSDLPRTHGWFSESSAQIHLTPSEVV